jgi:hypothetical protein
MILNYIKIFYRNMMINKGFSFINITGLAFGLATCLLIMLYIVDERDILTGLAAMVIALITVSFQAIRAAVANPVKSLRNE